MDLAFAIEEDRNMTRDLTSSQKNLIKRTVMQNRNLIYEDAFCNLVAKLNNTPVTSVFKTLVTREICKYIPC